MARDPNTPGVADAGPGGGSRGTAVVIDGDPDIRTLVRTALERLRIDVVADGRSGHEAVELARTWIPTVLVLEHPPHDVHHLDVVPHVRRASPSTCVVVYTARPFDLEAEPEALRPDHLVPKLGGVGALVDAIERCLVAIER
jgi:chemotaxis response regulator CheB